MVWPSQSPPLRILPLNFLANASRWLRNNVLHMKQFLTPFHLPHVRVAELSCPSIKDHLHSIKKWKCMLSPHHNVDLLPCPCAQFRLRLTDDCLQDGRIMCGFEQFVTVLNPPAQRWLADIAEASANSTYHHAGRHNARELRKQLFKRAVPKKLLLVKQGFRKKQAKEGTRSVRYNEITMFSFFHRWLPAVGEFIQSSRYDIKVRGIH